MGIKCVIYLESIVKLVMVFWSEREKLAWMAIDLLSTVASATVRQFADRFPTSGLGGTYADTKKL